MSVDTEAPPIDTEDRKVKDPKREDDDSKEKISPRLQSEVGRVASALFNRRTKEARSDPRASDSSKAIETADFIGHLDKKGIGEGYGFPDTHGKGPDGKPILGNPVYITIEGKKARLVQITDCDDDNLIGTYQFDGEDEDAGRVLNHPVSRQRMVEANLLAEREVILKGLTGDERVVAETYFQLIDPDAEELPEASDELPKQVGAVAEQNGMLTTNVVLEAADALYKGNPPAKVTEALSYLNGKTVLDKGDIEQAFNILGVGQDRESLGQQADQLLVQITQEKAKLEAAVKAGADTTMFQQRVDELNSHLALVTTADRLWKQQEAGGKSPIDNYLDKAANGELDPRFVAEFRAGKFDSVLDGLFKEAEQSMSDAEKAKLKSDFDKLKSGSWKAIKFGTLIMAMLAAIPAVAVVTVASGAGKMGR